MDGVIDLDTLESDNVGGSRSVNFGSGIELLMNDKKTKSNDGGSEIGIDDLTNLENDLNDLTNLDSNINKSTTYKEENISLPSIIKRMNDKNKKCSVYTMSDIWIDIGTEIYRIIFTIKTDCLA